MLAAFSIFWHCNSWLDRRCFLWHIWESSQTLLAAYIFEAPAKAWGCDASEINFYFRWLWLFTHYIFVIICDSKLHVNCYISCECHLAFISSSFTCHYTVICLCLISAIDLILNADRVACERFALVYKVAIRYSSITFYLTAIEKP